MPPPTLRAPLPPALSLFLLLFNLFCHVLSHFSHVQLFLTPWTAACQAPLSIGFSRQEYWTGLPFSPTGDLPRDQTQISCNSYVTGRFFTAEPSREPFNISTLLPSAEAQVQFTSGWWHKRSIRFREIWIGIIPSLIQFVWPSAIYLTSLSHTLLFWKEELIL